MDGVNTITASGPVGTGGSSFFSSSSPFFSSALLARRAERSTLRRRPAIDERRPTFCGAPPTLACSNDTCTLNNGTAGA